MVKGYGIGSFGQYVDGDSCGTLRAVGKDLGGAGKWLSLANEEPVTDTLTVSSCKKGFSGDQEIMRGGIT